MSDQLINDAKAKMENAISYLNEEYGKLQMGRANTALVESIMVESFGAVMPLKGLASISIPESNQIAIQPWNRDQLPNIEKAITNANLGFNPQNDGTVIRIILQPLTEERRKELVKLVHQYSEDARISIRNARHDALAHLKTMQKEKEISEDELSKREKELQDIVDDFNKKIEEAAKHKEQDVMTV
ncbi:ribosome recycling factor [Patescibacteria group bacterium]|nr:ribosome recycling factor [Patescibacteria group bacterium]MBU1682563.1 ribosome recycling factor [Patescibacteria group bacterium]MBU1934582.1 ribosome recycling factor [Patescibacteria group bacterium]